MERLPECLECKKPVVVKRLSALAEKGPTDIRDLFCQQCWRRVLQQAMNHAHGRDIKGVGGDEVH